MIVLHDLLPGHKPLRKPRPFLPFPLAHRNVLHLLHLPLGRLLHNLILTNNFHPLSLRSLSVRWHLKVSRARTCSCARTGTGPCGSSSRSSCRLWSWGRPVWSPSWRAFLGPPVWHSRPRWRDWWILRFGGGSRRWAGGVGCPVWLSVPVGNWNMPDLTQEHSVYLSGPMSARYMGTSQQVKMINNHCFYISNTECTYTFPPWPEPPI